MDDRKIIGALVEGAITYGVYLLMTTPSSDLVRAKSQMYRWVATSSQHIAELFGRVGMNAERKSKECLS